MPKLDCVQRCMESAFYKYGKFVSRHPLPFLIIPIVVSVSSLLGVINLTQVDDTEYLYTPTNGPAKDERTLIRNTFPENDTYYFQSARKSNRDGFFQVIVTAANGGNLYTVAYMNAIIALNNAIETLSTSDGTYLNLCGTWKGSCKGNALIALLNGTGNTIAMTNISYPMHNSMYFLGYQLGGVTQDSNSYVISAKAVILSYYLRYLSSDDVIRSDKWLASAKNLMSTYSSTGLKFDYQSSSSLSEELESSLSGIIPRVAMTYSVLMTFCVLTCLMLDWVRTKAWFALCGELAAGLAIVTSLGMLSAAGVQFSSTVGTMPFLIIGIGIDDMFVILSAWRHTSYTLPVEERMGLTFKTAAISITLTSVTDALAFLIGATSTFRSVTLFCAYTGVAVIFSYIWAITFLAAVLAYSGRGEEANRHEMTCMKILPTDKAEGRSKAYKIFCTGGYIPDNKETVSEKQEEKLDLPWLTLFMRDKFAPFLMKLPSKITILIVYCIYIGFAIWGILSLKEGLKVTNLAPDGSYLITYFDNEGAYFINNYGPKVMIVYTQSLDYSDATVRSNIFAELDSFRSNSLYYSDDIYFDSWLTSYLSFLQTNSIPIPSDITAFISTLRTSFLTVSPYDKFNSDIQFNSNYTSITSSRFLIQAKGVESTLDERKLMVESRKLAKDAAYDITVYHPSFIYFDQYTVIMLNTLLNLGIAVASMLVVSLVMLPSLISAFWVTISVLSICSGVIGYMVFWDVNLDSVSMINLIMCIGFSVDFSAHISYHFTISKGKTGKERAIDSLGQLGTPIVQGALSTILGAVVLSTSGSYIFRTFFKIMFLVMVFGFAHAMFFLPVVLSVIGPPVCCNNNNNVVAEVDDDKKEKAVKHVYENGVLTIEKEKQK